MRTKTWWQRSWVCYHVGWLFITVIKIWDKQLKRGRVSLHLLSVTVVSVHGQLSLVFLSGEAAYPGVWWRTLLMSWFLRSSKNRKTGTGTNPLPKDMLLGSWLLSLHLLLSRKSSLSSHFPKASHSPTQTLAMPFGWQLRSKPQLVICYFLIAHSYTL